MNKKILLGSIIAGAVLIGVSFTTVVGYRSATSDVRASPLFNIRSSRAIDVESRDLSCEYVGMGEDFILSIPKRDSRTALIQKVIDRISKMDDLTFDKFIGLVVNHLKQENIIDEKAISKIITLLKQLRNAPMNPENYIMVKNIDSKNKLPTGGFTMQCETFCGDPCNTLKASPVACFILMLVFLPIIIPIVVLYLLWFYTFLSCFC